MSVISYFLFILSSSRPCLFLLDSLFNYTPEDSLLPASVCPARLYITHLLAMSLHCHVSPGVPLLMHCASHSLCTHFLLNFNFFLEVTPHQARSGNPFSKVFPLAWAMDTCEYKHFSLEEITGFLQLQTHVALSVRCQTLLYISFISPEATCGSFCTLVNFCLSFFSFSCCVSFNSRF